MSARRLPVRPDLTQLKHQAKDLLRAIRSGDPSAVAELRQYHPAPPEPSSAKLADAQLVLARSYEASSWPRLVQSCNLIDAIWRDDVEAVREIVVAHPQLLHENAGIRNSNWGPPMTYAANLGRDRIIKMLHDQGATDLGSAIGRATLQSRIGTARMLHTMLGGPRPPDSALGGPAYTLSVSGTALLLELGARIRDDAGRSLAPVDVVLETDSRNPSAKHQILEMYAQHGCQLPDTATMALHRGRIDLLEEHLRRDSNLPRRTFTFAEIFPPDLGCHEEDYPRTTLEGATLLHVCVEFDELEIARWLLEKGMNVDAPAAVDAEGFGGHTALFSAVVSYPNFWLNYTGGWSNTRKAPDSPFARLLLEHGADPNARASLREQVIIDGVKTTREHRGITPLAWGERFHNQMVVSGPAMRLVAQHGGKAIEEKN
jgi:ankyrin repeat protein